MTLLEMMKRDADEALAVLAQRLEDSLLDPRVPDSLSQLRPPQRASEDEIRMSLLRASYLWQCR